MRELRELRRYRQNRVLATCAKHRHSVRMATQKTQIRQRLGAEIARLRAQQGMATQADLAKVASLGLRSVWAVENGEKVAPRTLRKIESALRLPTGAIDDFLEKQLDHLVEPSSAAVAASQPVTEELAPLDEVLTATVPELAKLARMYAWYEARQRGDDPDPRDEERFMMWALQRRADQRRSIEPPGDGNRDAS